VEKAQNYEAQIKTFLDKKLEKLEKKMELTG